MAFLASLPGVAGWAALVLQGGYLILATVLALVSALSRRASRRDAAYRALALLWPRRESRAELTDTDDPPPLPPGRRRRGTR